MPMSMSTSGYQNPLAMGNLPPGYYPSLNGGYDPNLTGSGQPAFESSDPAYAGMPDMPTYNSPWNSTMAVTPGLESQLSDINLQPLESSVQNYANLAEQQGPSAWATLAGQQQNALAGNQLEQGAAQANAGTEGAISQLGESGGITSGARERAAEGGNTNLMNMTQNVGRQNTLNQLQIGVNDQQNKMQEMAQLPGMESQALAPQFQEANMWEQAQNTDITNAMNSNASANQWNENNYNQQMQAWAANQQANATENSGKK